MEKIKNVNEALEAIAQTGKESQENNKKVQLSIAMLKELTENKELLKAYLEIITTEEIKTPIAYQMAKREIKQQKIEI